MPIDKNSSQYKEMQRKKKLAEQRYNDNRAMRYTQRINDEIKLRMFEDSITDEPLSEQKRGPNSFHEFHADDKDPAESKVVTDMNSQVLEAIKKIRKVNADDVVKILNQALLHTTKPIEATQLFMAAFKRVRELFWNDNAPGVNKAVTSMLDAINSQHVKSLCLDDDRDEQTRIGIEELITNLEFTKKPAIKGKETQTPLRRKKNKKPIYDHTTQAEMPAWEGEGPAPARSSTPGLTAHSSVTTSSDDDESMHSGEESNTPKHTRAEGKRIIKQREILTIEKLGGKATEPYRTKTVNIIDDVSDDDENRSNKAKKPRTNP
jgi:hypothetical protein